MRQTTRTLKLPEGRPNRERNATPRNEARSPEHSDKVDGFEALTFEKSVWFLGYNRLAETVVMCDYFISNFRISYLVRLGGSNCNLQSQY